MAEFNKALTSAGRKCGEVAWKAVKCKPIAMFGIFLVLTLFLNAVHSPLAFLALMATYLSGAILIFWAFTFIRIG